MNPEIVPDDVDHFGEILDAQILNIDSKIPEFFQEFLSEESFSEIGKNILKYTNLFLWKNHEVNEDELPEINMQKGSRTKVESDSDSDPDYLDYLKQTQAKNKKKNAKMPKNINGFESEESENYFSTSEDEINDIEISHEGNDGENYEENLEENFEDDLEDDFEKNFEQNFEENFEDNLEENFEEKFEENQEENLKEKFEEPYFNENLKLNQRSQINSGKNDNDHDNYNRPPQNLLL